MNAIYPNISQAQLIGMNVDQILAKDQGELVCTPSSASIPIFVLDIVRILGTSKKIVAKDSEIFAQKIDIYIEDKDRT